MVRRSASQGAAPRWQWMFGGVSYELARRIAGPCHAIFAIMKHEANGPLSLAKSTRDPTDRVDHWSQLIGRAANDAKYLRSRGLVVERFLHLARASLHFLEQTG